MNEATIKALCGSSVAKWKVILYWFWANNMDQATTNALRETINALRESIVKWKAIFAGTGIDKGPNNCPLCKRFYANDCSGCPVWERTEARYCLNNEPYSDWSLHHSGHHKTKGSAPVSVKCGTCQKIAEAELHFLRGLLPVNGSEREPGA